MPRRALVLAAIVAAPALLLAAPGADAPACDPVAAFYQDVAATTAPGTLVELKLVPTDAQLAQMGLPPRGLLENRRFAEPTIVREDGSREVVPHEALAPRGGSSLAAWGGAGCLGIRPGALLLNLNGGIALCSFAHVYGNPGSHQISTAGHCTKTGEVLTMVGFLGEGSGPGSPVLLDVGKTAQSMDGGPGRDWALVSVFPQHQDLVTPTMCAWGGPRGEFTAQGETVHVEVPRRIPDIPSVSADTDPALVQDLVHFGHGLGLGGPGTGSARTGAGFVWGPDSFTFVGAITPGDSGSGANTADGRAAGIITHLVHDPFLRFGVGTALGTRVSEVPANLADGQLVPYPVPLNDLP